VLSQGHVDVAGQRREPAVEHRPRAVGGLLGRLEHRQQPAGPVLARLRQQ
jgi:hypothetical protein